MDAATTRYVLVLEYDGTGLMGWQRQMHGPSVQGYLEAAVHAYCGVGGEPYAAGRTDAGVHATAQVVHVDLPRRDTPFRVQMALNAHLFAMGVRISVVRAALAPPGFHARFSATGRTYTYRIVHRRAPLALDAGRVWHVRTLQDRRLDVPAMQAAAALLVGHHDFTSFRATECQGSSPCKTLDRLEVTQPDGPDGERLEVHAASRSFLHHQVRNMTGTLVNVGQGKLHPEDIPRILAARQRSAAGPTAPAEGLYFTGVEYPAPGITGWKFIP